MQIRTKSVVIGTAAALGVAGFLVAGSGMFANAAGTTPIYTADTTACLGAPVAPPVAPLFKKTFTVGSGKVSGTIPAPSLAALAVAPDYLVPQLIHVDVTTQYNSGRSGAGKTDIVTVNLPGHQYNNPLLFNIPPVVVGEDVGTGAVNYSASTTGKAFATVTVTETISQAASTIPETVLGTTCPTGTTKIAVQQGNLTPIPTATATSTASPTASATATGTKSATPSATATSTGSATATATASSTATSIIPIP